MSTWNTKIILYEYNYSHQDSSSVLCANRNCKGNLKKKKSYLLNKIKTWKLSVQPSLSLWWSVLDFWKINFEKSSWMNWIFAACVACKNQFRTWFFQLDFLKFKYRSTGGHACSMMPRGYRTLFTPQARKLVQVITECPVHPLKKQPWKLVTVITSFTVHPLTQNVSKHGKSQSKHTKWKFQG